MNEWLLWRVVESQFKSNSRWSLVSSVCTIAVRPRIVRQLKPFNRDLHTQEAQPVSHVTAEILVLPNNARKGRHCRHENKGTHHQNCPPKSDAAHIGKHESVRGQLRKHRLSRARDRQCSPSTAEPILFLMLYGHQSCNKVKGGASQCHRQIDPQVFDASLG